MNVKAVLARIFQPRPKSSAASFEEIYRNIDIEGLSSPLIDKEILARVDSTHAQLLSSIEDTRKQASALAENLSSELEQTRRRAAIVSDIVQDALLTLDYNGNIRSANGAARRLFNRSEEDLLYRNISHVYPTKLVLEREAVALFDYIESQQSTSQECRTYSMCNALYQEFCAQGHSIAQPHFRNITTTVDGRTVHLQGSIGILNPESTDFKTYLYVLFLKDVTAEVDAVNKVEHLAQLQVSILGAMSNPVFYRDADRHISGYNAAFLDLLQIGAPDGKSIKDIQPEAVARQFSEIDNILSDADTQDIHTSSIAIHRHKAKTAVPCAVYSSVVRTAAGEISGFVTTMVDLSNLFSMQALQDTLLETVPNPICIFDERLKHTACNTSYANLVGRDKSRIIGFTYEETLMPELMTRPHLQEIARENKRLDFELFSGVTQQQTIETRAYHRLTDSLRAVLSYRVALYRDERFSGVLVVLTDVSTLREREKLQDMLINAVPYPVFIKDKSLTYRSVNTAFEEWFGLPRDMLIGNSLDAVILAATKHISPEHTALMAKNMDAIRQLLNTVSEHDAELFSTPFSAPQIFNYHLLNMKTGKFCDIVFHRHGIYSDDGEFIGVAGIIEDRTNSANLDRVLAVAAQRLEFAYVRTDMSGVIEDCDNQFAAIFGSTRDRLVDKFLPSVYTVSGPIKNSAAGAIQDMEVTTHPLTNPDGQQTGIVYILTHRQV